MKLRAVSIATGLALALGSSSALAFTLPLGIGTTAGAQGEDDNIDFLQDNDQSGDISEGDNLVAFFEFGQIIDILAANGTVPPQDLNRDADELVGVASAQVTGIETQDGVVTRVNFGPTGAGPAVSVYSLGSEIDFDYGNWVNCSDFASCQASIVDGDLWATFGFVDADDEWFFTPAPAGPAPLDPDAIAAANASTDVGVVNFALSVLVNNTGYNLAEQQLDCGIFTCAGDGLTDLVGQSSVLGGLGLPESLLEDGAFARTDTDVQVNVQAVPEPGMLGLLGMGLLGFGASRLRKRN